MVIHVLRHNVDRTVRRPSRAKDYTSFLKRVRIAGRKYYLWLHREAGSRGDVDLRFTSSLPITPLEDRTPR
eukprot:625396-Pyramimonas_sp.AAC.1